MKKKEKINQSDPSQTNLATTPKERPICLGCVMERRKSNEEKRERRNKKTLMADVGRQQNNCLSRKEVKERRKQKPAESLQLSGINVSLSFLSLIYFIFIFIFFCVFQLVGHSRRVLGVISLSQQQARYFCFVAFPNVTCRGVV